MSVKIALKYDGVDKLEVKNKELAGGYIGWGIERIFSLYLPVRYKREEGDHL